MKQVEMIKGARKIVDQCMGVQEGEHVLIMTEMSTPMSIAEVLAIACKERGAEPLVMIMSPAKGGASELPPPVAAAMARSQVILLGTRGTFHSESRVRATNAGARCLAMSEFTEEDMYQGAVEANFLEAKKLIQQVYSALEKAKEARVTTPAGTDLYLDLRGRLEMIMKFDGVYHRPGEYGSLGLEVAVSPTVGKAQGVFVCDGTTTAMRQGVLKESVRATVKDGMVTEISGGNDARKIADRLSAMGDPKVYNVVELGIGLNPKVSVMKGVHRDKGFFGSCHIGIGSNVTWGGKIKAATHCDFLMYTPKLELDGVTILENYQFKL